MDQDMDDPRVTDSHTSEAGSGGRQEPGDTGSSGAQRDDESTLRAALGADPNDVAAFGCLVEIVRRRAVEELRGLDPARVAADAAWSLAEELAGSPRAWYPLVELGCLSVAGDREAAMRRFRTASDRDPRGAALAMSLRRLREAGHAADAVVLGISSWRPATHGLAAGRHLVAAAVDAGRAAEVRRHLDALAASSAVDLSGLFAELERLVAAAAERAGAQQARPREIDLRDGAVSGERGTATDAEGPSHPTMRA
mgnify:FL=1